MPFVHGKNAKLYLWDSTSACRDISGDMNSLTVSWTRDNIETTTMGKDSKQRLSGIKDFSIQYAGLHNAETASGIVTVLENMASTSAINLVRAHPGGSITGCIVYNACMLMSAYDHNAPVNGPVAVTFTMQLAAGSPTSACA